MEDLNVDPNFTNAIAEAGHGSDDECLKATLVHCSAENLKAQAKHSDPLIE